MLAKYNIEYAMPFRRQVPAYHYYSDDPVACEEFLLELLERGFKIQAIRHDGAEMTKADSDKMIKKAAGMLASKALCHALGISADEEHYRFGFTA